MAGRKWKSEIIRKMLSEGVGGSEVARRCGVSTAAVSYHNKILGLGHIGKQYDWTVIQKAYDAGMSTTQCKSSFGIPNSTWSKSVSNGRITLRSKLQNARLASIRLDGNVSCNARKQIKQAFLNAGILKLKCYGDGCGLTKQWLNKPLSVQLHHIDGNAGNHSESNITLLCPNCHSQTPTFAGRNPVIKRKARENMFE